MKESKIKKVIVEYDDHIRSIKGLEAEKWDRHCSGIISLAQAHNRNPFQTDPIKWKIDNYFKCLNIKQQLIQLIKGDIIKFKSIAHNRGRQNPYLSTEKKYEIIDIKNNYRGHSLAISIRDDKGIKRWYSSLSIIENFKIIF